MRLKSKITKDGRAFAIRYSRSAFFIAVTTKASLTTDRYLAIHDFPTLPTPSQYQWTVRVLPAVDTFVSNPCCQGGAAEPPADVAHLQFKSAIAWKLVWVPAGGFRRFVLVDDAGKQLATGVPTGRVPAMREREYNYQVLRGGRYAKAADAYGAP